MKTVLITGVSRGIGKALAQKFLSEKYFVIGTSLTGDADFSDENLLIKKLDLSVTESILQCVDEIKMLDKKIDIHINNAGVLLDNEDTNVVIEKLRKTLEVNLIGTIDFTERMLSKMNNGGHIVNISSQAGSLSDVEVFTHSHAPLRYPAYKISKAALNMYMRTLALRLRGVATVSSVHPGWVKTDMGGQDADITPEEAARDIFTFAISNPESGHFWYKGAKMEW